MVLSVTPKDMKQYTPPIKEKSCDKEHMEEKQTHRHRKQTCGENMIVQEYVDVEYISLHRYIRNTPSNTEVQAEQHLKADGNGNEYMEKNI